MKAKALKIVGKVARTANNKNKPTPIKTPFIYFDLPKLNTPIYKPIV
jgi:hypothetical protein